MDFISWHSLVLKKLIELSESDENYWHIGVSADSLSKALFNQSISNLAANNKGKAIIDALRELKNNRLIVPKGGYGNFFELTLAAEQFATDFTPLWKSICSYELKPKEQEVLEVVNRLSEHTADDHAWVEYVGHNKLMKELGWNDEKELWPIASRLDKHLGFLDPDPAMNSDSGFRSTYAGLVRGANCKLNIKSKNVHSVIDNLEAAHTLRVFLCHSSGDKQAVRDLYRQLRMDGITPWLDEEDLLPGQEWEQEIPKAVRNSDVVIVCLSQAAINKRGYVQKEIRIALDVADQQPEGAIFLIPVKLEECEAPERLRRWHWVNLFESNGYQRLMQALRSRAKALGISQGL